jgi:hypothetical protein
MSEPQILARKVTRLGRQTLFERGGRFFMAISNRTYRSYHEVPAGRVPLWKDYLGSRRDG